MPSGGAPAVMLLCLGDARELRDDERQFVRFAATAAAVVLERADTAGELAAGREAQVRLQAITAARSDSIKAAPEQRGAGAEFNRRVRLGSSTPPALVP